MHQVSRIVFLAGMLALLGAAVLAATTEEGNEPTMTPDQDARNLLFIHHSCGGQLFADQGENAGSQCIYVSHPNGGGLRRMLENAGFAVNEASYGSIVGADTDICHWHRKFASQMDRILQTRNQDELLPDGQRNDIVCFKSCFPNNDFKGEGKEPGDPDSCEKTVANARAAYRTLLPFFREHPDVLFVAFTAPPMAEYKPVGWKAKIKSWFRPKDRSGELARQFNTWLADREQGWLAGYDQPNVVVFNYYDVLTDHGATNYAAYPTRDGRDSHPSSTGNQKAAAAFMPFLEAATAGMSWPNP
jgi:hypothetical protein